MKDFGVPDFIAMRSQRCPRYGIKNIYYALGSIALFLIVVLLFGR